MAGCATSRASLAGRMRSPREASRTVETIQPPLAAEATASTTNTIRQPQVCAIAAASGAAITLDSVTPTKTTASALPRRSTGVISAPIAFASGLTAPAPMPATMRVASSQPKPGAAAPASVAATSATSPPSSRLRRRACPASICSKGAPIAKAIENALISSAARPGVMRQAPASAGSAPTTPYDIAPTAKLALASARSACRSGSAIAMLGSSRFDPRVRATVCVRAWYI
ncbi:hypothetical protein BUGL105410_37565 [Burkholderia gladioli]